MARYLLALLMVLLLTPPVEAATTRVRWTKVEVRPGDDARRVGRALEKLLVQASRKAKWGKGERLALQAKVTKLAWEEHEDVLRVTVTVVARIEGGESARAHIRIGGRPKDRRTIEGDALDIVASGLVTRLSDIARREAAERERAEEKSPEKPPEE